MVRAAPHDEFTCFVDERAGAVLDLTGPNVRRVVVRQAVSPTAAASADSARSPVDMLRLTRAVARERLDVFFSPTVYSFFPLPPGLPAVITIHDTIAERFPELTLPTWRARLFWKAKVALALRQARLVLTTSNYAASQIASVLHVPRNRVRVATAAPARAYCEPSDAREIALAAASVGLTGSARYFVYLGGFNPHKHVDVLVRAHARAARGREDPPHLLLVGTIDADVFHGALGSIRTAIGDAGTAALVHWTGFVADETLPRLLAGALALVLPSASEGFGLPAVEAAACGTPVVATTESPLPELLAGGGIFVPPGDEAALAAALSQLLDDEAGRAAMGFRARERATALTWDKGAHAALAALREAAG